MRSLGYSDDANNNIFNRDEGELNSYSTHSVVHMRLKMA